MPWLKLLKNNLNQQPFNSKHLLRSYLEVIKHRMESHSTSCLFLLKT